MFHPKLRAKQNLGGPRETSGTTHPGQEQLHHQQKHIFFTKLPICFLDFAGLYNWNDLKLSFCIFFLLGRYGCIVTGYELKSRLGLGFDTWFSKICTLSESKQAKASYQRCSDPDSQIHLSSQQCRMPNDPMITPMICSSSMLFISYFQSFFATQKSLTPPGSRTVPLWLVAKSAPSAVSNSPATRDACWQPADAGAAPVGSRSKC